MLKNLLFLSLFSFSFLHVFSQQKSLTYNDANDVGITVNIKNYTKFDSYVTKSGDIIAVGDSLIIGKPSNQDNRYGPFSNIVLGKLKTTDLKNFDFLPSNCSGNIVIVKEIMAVHVKEHKSKFWTSANPFKKNSPVYINLLVQNPKKASGALSLFLAKSKRTVIDLEKSLENGEISNPNSRMTKEEAIAKLKESKDLMELGFLSKEEYERLKQKLSPIITGE